MSRAAFCLFWIMSCTLLLNSAPMPGNKAGPEKRQSLEEIKKAIEDLGSKRFVVRDKAKKLLQEAGAVAEPLLEEAALSADEEISSSAKAILEKFQWGIYPETPKELRDVIERYRTGTIDQRQNVLGELLKRKPIPFATLRKLLQKEENAEAREQLFASLHLHARDAIVELLKRKDHDGTEELFNLILTGAPELAAHDYAVFMCLRGKIDSSIARFEKERLQNGKSRERAAEVLVQLYRIKGDWMAARKAAEDAKKEQLVESVLWQSGDWKALAAYSSKVRPPNRMSSGLIAAYERLAGNTKAFDDQVSQIKKSAEEVIDEDVVTFRLEMNALLLNSKASDAISIMTEKKREMALAFDLLCMQMKHKEAFELVDEARRRDTNPLERNKIEIRRARMLYLLGEKDAASQLFQKVALEIKGIEGYELARALIKTTARLGMRDMAAEQAATAISTLLKIGQGADFKELLEPIFGDDYKVAWVWWNLFRRELPNEEPVKAMRRVRDVFAGKLERDKLNEWVAKLEKGVEAVPTELRRMLPERGPRPKHTRLDAAAAAFRAAGDDAKTAEYLKKSAQNAPTQARWIAYGDFLMAKKQYQAAAESYGKAANQLHSIDADIEIGDDGLFTQWEEASAALPTYLQGRALLQAGDTTEGKRLIEIAHWLPLGNERIRAQLVDELNKRDWPEMAMNEAQMVVKTGWYDHFSYGNVLSYLARDAAKEKSFFKSTEYYEKCIVGCLRTGASFVEPTAYILVPESVRVYRARGLIAEGKTEEGLREALANLDVMPGNVELAIKLVPELEKLGKKKEADAIYARVRDEYAKLCAAYPASAYAHNSAAWLMANCRREIDAALKHAQKAVELEPKNAGYMDTLAEVNFRNGNREKALSIMKECVALDPKSTYFRKQLVRFKDQPFESPTPDEGGEDE